MTSTWKLPATGLPWIKNNGKNSTIEKNDNRQLAQKR